MEQDSYSCFIVSNNQIYPQIIPFPNLIDEPSARHSKRHNTGKTFTKSSQRV